jgi:hypothetical protein
VARVDQEIVKDNFQQVSDRKDWLRRPRHLGPKVFARGIFGQQVCAFADVFVRCGGRRLKTDTTGMSVFRHF